MKENREHHMLVPRRRGLRESRCDLRQLIYWMENDRRLDAAPDKIVLLRKLLAEIENQLEIHSKSEIHSVSGSYQHN